MYEDTNDKEIIINNEFDYSNKVAEVENISILIQYCESLYNQLLNLINEDEEKNERLKLEFRDYQYKKSYSNIFEILIRKKNTYNDISFKSLDTFNESVKSGQLVNLEKLSINLDLCYKRGKNSDLRDYENNFKFVFKPYDIKFFRKSNHNESSMNQIEENFNKLFEHFREQKCIFNSDK